MALRCSRASPASRRRRARRSEGDDQGRRDRGRGNGGRAAAERDVPRRARERPQGARAREREDADELHPDPAGRPCEGRAVAVRPHSGPNHLSVQVRTLEKWRQGSDEGTTVDQSALRTLQDRQASGRDADHLQESATQSPTGVKLGGGLRLLPMPPPRIAPAKPALERNKGESTWREWREWICRGRSGAKSR